MGKYTNSPCDLPPLKLPSNCRYFMDAVKGPTSLHGRKNSRR